MRPSAQKWEGNHARLASNGQRVEECLRKHPEHLDLTKGLKASTTRVARHRFIAPVLTPRKKKISVDSAFIQRPKDRYQIDLEAILRAEGYLDDDDLSTNTGYSGSRPNSRGDMSRGSDEGDLDGPRRGGESEQGCTGGAFRPRGGARVKVRRAGRGGAREKFTGRGGAKKCVNYLICE